MADSGILKKINTRKISALLILLLLIGVSIVPVTGQVLNENRITSLEKQTDLDSDFDWILTLLMKLGHYNSLSACIIKNDEVVWADGYGYYDLENEKKTTEHTINMICSITKTITGTALMQLYDQGLFDLDEDVNNYLPFSLRNPNFPDDPITFRMLLSHSSSLLEIRSYLNVSNLRVGDPPISGYPYPWLEEYLISGGTYYNPVIWNEEYRPGELNSYANINFDIIAYFVELFSNQPFHEYCQEHIFIPLGMINTSFCLNDFNLDDVAVPYIHSFGRRFIKLDYYSLLEYPAGGLYSSVLDLSHFLIAHMNGGVYNSVRILEEDTVDEMHKIQPPGNKIVAYFYYGLAWMSGEYPDGKGEVFSGHGGDLYGIHTYMLYRPSDNTAIIFFLNGGGLALKGFFTLQVLMPKVLFSIADEL